MYSRWQVNKEKEIIFYTSNLKEKIYRPRIIVIKLRKWVRGFPDDVETTVCKATPTECIFRIPSQSSMPRLWRQNKKDLCRLFVYVYISWATGDKRFDDSGIFSELIFSELKVCVNIKRFFLFHISPTPSWKWITWVYPVWEVNRKSEQIIFNISIYNQKVLNYFT